MPPLFVITANQVTVFRLALLPIILLSAMMGGEAGRWAAVVLLALAGLSDMLDGAIARKTGTASPFGAMLDLIADRLLIATMIVLDAVQGLHLLPALLILWRCLIVASFREAAGDRLQLPVTPLEKFKIALQFAAFFLLLAPDFFPAQKLAGLVALWGAAGVTSVTLFSYFNRVRHLVPGPHQSGSETGHE